MSKSQEMHSVRLPLEAIYVDHEFNARQLVESEEGDTYDELKQLANQIKRDGQLSPVLVRKLEEDDTEGLLQYQLVFGFRRYHAMQMLGEQTIMAQVWEGDEKDAYFVNLAENVARANLKAHEKADRYAYLKREMGISGREIARRLSENSGHVNNLIRIVEEGDPRILELWRKGHGKATTDALVKKVIKKGANHAEQWENWLKHCGLEDELDGDGDDEGEAAVTEVADKIKRPSMKHLEAALEALKASNKDDAWKKGARAALRWAAAKTKTLPGVYNPEKPPAASEGEGDAE